MITVSAPAKVILMGDHAVVHGKPAIAAAIDKRIRVRVEEGSGQTCVSGASIQTELVEKLVSIVCHEYKIHPRPILTIHISSDFPFGHHIGSSAALAVASIGAITYYLKKIWNPTGINQLAYEMEKTIHGTPSGIDNTACTFGGFVWYRKELEFLRSIWQLPLKLPANLQHFYLIDTGRPTQTTKEMVSMVNQKVNQKPRVMERIFADNEREAKNVALAIKVGNEETLMRAINAGSRTLEKMGVVSALARSMIQTIVRSKGAAKILGGGGKKGSVGYLLAYHPDEDKFSTACHHMRVPFERIHLGEEGVKLEDRSYENNG